MEDGLEQALSLKELCRATKQCKKGVLWKDSTANHFLRALTKNQRLADEVREGRYKLSPYTIFTIYEPKKRTISATKMRDRVLQRSLCNNGVREDLTRGFIYDNGACIRGKGKDFTVCRVQCQLERYYRKHGADGWAVHLDVKSYFPSTPHREIKKLLQERIREEAYLPYLFEIVDSYSDGSEDPRGIGLGSETSQLVQLALLNRLDHRMKEEVKPDVYIRYMDDFLIVDHDREKVEACRRIVTEELEKLSLKCTDKEGVYPLSRGVKFLQMRFILTESGKVVTKISDRSIRRERRQLRNLKELEDRGERTKACRQKHYQSWIATVKPYDSGNALRAMDRYYENLFKEKPQYKYKRRKHRHGSFGNSRTAPQGAAEKRCPGTGEQKTEGPDRVHCCMRSPGDAGGG